MWGKRAVQNRVNPYDQSPKDGRAVFLLLSGIPIFACLKSPHLEETVVERRSFKIGLHNGFEGIYAHTSSGIYIKTREKFIHSLIGNGENDIIFVGHCTLILAGIGESDAVLALKEGRDNGIHAGVKGSEAAVQHFSRLGKNSHQDEAELIIAAVYKHDVRLEIRLIHRCDQSSQYFP